jgi:hypothetical protein
MFHRPSVRGAGGDSVSTLVGQRVFGITLGDEDLNDHDELRHDPVMRYSHGRGGDYVPPRLTFAQNRRRREKTMTPSGLRRAINGLKIEAPITAE